MTIVKDIKSKDGLNSLQGINDVVPPYLSGMDMEIWEKELTVTEIIELYNNGTGLSYPFGVEEN